VIYKESGRKAILAGVIIGTLATQLASSTSLTDADHVHLAVFTPFVTGPQVAPPAPMGVVTPSGMTLLYNVPYWAPTHGMTYDLITEGCWTWPF
jgi:hypothetical protein